MKEFHPSAHLVDGSGNFVGMILHKTHRNGFSAPNGTLAFPVNVEQFTRLVAEGKVQLFGYREGRVILEYTPEELRITKKKATPILELDEYFKNDITFNGYNVSKSPEYMLMSVYSAFETGMLYMMASVIYRDAAFSDADIKGLKKIVRIPPRKMAENMYMVIARVEDTISIIKDYPCGIDVNCDTMMAGGNVQQALFKGRISLSEGERLHQIASLVERAQLINSQR